MSGKGLSGKVIVRETSNTQNNRQVRHANVRERSCPGNVCPGKWLSGKRPLPVVHNTAQNSSIDFSSYSADNHHSSCRWVYLQWRSQELFPGEQNSGGLAIEVPHGVQGRSRGGGIGAKPPEANDLTIKYSTSWRQITQLHKLFNETICITCFRVTVSLVVPAH